MFYNIFNKKWFRSFLFLFFISLQNSSAQELYYKSDLTASLAYERYKNGVLIFDIRTPQEYENDHIPGSVLIPAFFEKNKERIFNENFIDQIDAALKGDMDKEVMLICRSGSRTKFAANLLGKEGYTNVHNISHGFRTSKYKDDWTDLNLPIEK